MRTRGVRFHLENGLFPEPGVNTSRHLLRKVVSSH